MAEPELLNHCIKCKCSLSSPDKSSKLLPCLHTMCEECISGRTDVAEKIKRMKEEKEQKTQIADSANKQECESATKEKEHDIAETEERNKVEQDDASASQKDPPSVDNSNDVNDSVEVADRTESKTTCEPTKNSEQPSAEKKAEDEVKDEDQEKKNEDQEQKNEDEEQKNENEEEKVEDHEKDEVKSAEKSPDQATVETTKEDEHGGETTTVENSHTPDQADAVGVETAEASASEEDKSKETEIEAKQPENSDQDVEVDRKAETESATVPENQPSDENQRNAEEESMEVVEEEADVVEEEPPPPAPVPLAECPVCREPFNAENLIDNVFIRKQAATPEDGEGTEQKCTGCECNPATSYCVQCDDWLCSDCVNAHKRVRMTKDHVLTTLEEALTNKGNSSGPVEVSMMCRVHPKEKLTLFCERCEVLTCRDCQLLQHQEHKYQFLQEAADTYKAKLTGSLSLMKDRREVLRRYQTEIEERLSKVKREKSDLQQEILRQADVIVKAVRQAVWSVLSSLHSFTDAAAKRLSREVGDVRDLVGKFDHCISFMDGILEDGFGLPLLYSKAIVETKCRKVYHTHMEPQSLKGQLNIQYRHDVPTVLRCLPSIGAIYVNGSKYPPEKSTPQSQSSPNTASSHGSTSSHRGSAAPTNVVVGGVPLSQGLPHHPSHQDRNNLFTHMQMMMRNQPHTNTVSSQGHTLALPGSRRVSNLGPAPRGWASQQLGLPSSQGGLMGSMLGQGQSVQHQMMTARGPAGPAFTPMRLHHRPVEPNHMPSASTMVLGAPHRPQHPFSTLPAPPPLRSPVGQPQYRGAAEGLHMNSGGQAAMSGVRRQSSMMDTNPDPARPASGGHNTPERPLSSEGAASSMRVKSEPQDSLDCVITSANFKTKKPTAVASSTLGELQKNLDEVIRGVPLDLGDNLEQINCGDSLGNHSGVRTSAPSLPHVTSPGSAPNSTAVSKDTTPTTASSHPTAVSASPSSTTSALSSTGETRLGGESTASLGGTDPGLSVETEGHQVKGYATGNSMPGFTLAAVESADPNDDYCASCHQGGDVLCCDKCPRVFHLQCHVPVLATVPSGTFVCTLCEEGLMTDGMEDGLTSDTSLKRKASNALSSTDLKVCERVLLELYCHPSSIPFHEPVNRAVPNYYKIIANPMDFSTIKAKLAPSHVDHYISVEAFLDDCRLVFRNCAIYNSETSEVGKAGKIVQGFFDRLVDRHMPEFGSYARRQLRESPETEVRQESERKKRKLTPPPPSASQGETSAGPVAQ